MTMNFHYWITVMSSFQYCWNRFGEGESFTTRLLDTGFTRPAEIVRVNRPNSATEH